MSLNSIMTFGKVKTPCGDCIDGHCTMNCSGREIVHDPDEAARGDMFRAINAWLTCPKEKRPSAAALGDHISKIAGRLAQ